jgi:putative DNA primase/helicase
VTGIVSPPGVPEAPSGAPELNGRRAEKVEPERSFLRTDLGNGERLIARHGRDLRYLSAWKKWLVWDGRRWAIDETKEVERRAKETIRSIWKEVFAHRDAGRTQEAQDLTKHVMSSEQDGRIRAMLARAQAEPGVAITPAQLDTDPWRLTVANGVIDLHTGELLPHDRAALATKYVPVTYDPAAECPRWHAFLHRIMAGSEELIRFLQLAVGYSLTGDTSEQALFFLYGFGRNGKSTFLEVLRQIAGEYASQADFATFLEKKGDGPRNDVARLFGARVVTSSEVGEGKRFNESLVKSLTGSDTVAARMLYAEAFEFKPTFKLWLSANHRPVIRGTDDGIWRRMRLVPFSVQIPEAERDKTLAEALTAELPGVLAWAVQGCLLWLERGLDTPDPVREATETYRRDSDTLGAFLEEWTEPGPDYSERAADLYEAYRRWARDAGEHELSQKSFGNQLTERAFRAEKQGSGSNRVVHRLGLRLTKSLSAMGPAPTRRGDDTPDWFA